MNSVSSDSKHQGHQEGSNKKTDAERVSPRVEGCCELLHESNDDGGDAAEDRSVDSKCFHLKDIGDLLECSVVCGVVLIRQRRSVDTDDVNAHGGKSTDQTSKSVQGTMKIIVLIDVE